MGYLIHLIDEHPACPRILADSRAASVGASGARRHQRCAESDRSAAVSRPFDVAESIDKFRRWTSVEVGRRRAQGVLKEFEGSELADTARPDMDRLVDDVDTTRLYWVTDSMTALLSAAAA